MDIPLKEFVTECYNACKNITRLFIFGRRDSKRCNADGCECICEQSDGDGECNNWMTKHEEFDLYISNANAGILYVFLL